VYSPRLACLRVNSTGKRVGAAASRMAIRPSGILIRDFQEQEDEVRGACNANARRLNAERARAASVCGETTLDLRPAPFVWCSLLGGADRSSLGDERHRLKASTLTSHPSIFYLHPQINETSCCYSFRAVCDRCTQHVIRERERIISGSGFWLFASFFARVSLLESQSWPTRVNPSELFQTG
jgi:hypothetical protein